MAEKALENFEAAVTKAIDEKKVANAVVVASTKDFKYEKAFGRKTLDESSPPVQLDATFWIFSCTKMITTVAVMQCVERGLVTLDQPLSSILPEWANPPLLTGTGAKDSPPVVETTNHAITLRHLLSHTSGMGYMFSNPLIEAWAKARDAAGGGGHGTWDIAKEYNYPLTFAPGTPGKWQYSVGIDWAGKVVERVNGNVRLGEYMAENIFKPLGVRDMTFRPSEDTVARLVPRVLRDEEDRKLSMHPMDTLPVVREPVDDCGGAGLYGTAEDYHRVLESLVRDDGRVLSSASVAEMFRPQLVEHEDLQAIMWERNILKRMGTGLSEEEKGKLVFNHGLAGVLAVNGIPETAGEGTMWWTGLANTLWFMDRASGTCGFYGSQLLPAGDEETGLLFKKLQQDLFKAAKAK